jgi:hypothetical protein
MKINLMKKILVFIVVFFSIFFLSCRQSQTSQKQVNSNTKIEVMYFHTSMRCPACIAIENNTKKVLYDFYKTQMDNGIIRFTPCNIDDKSNSSILEKYQVSYLTLLIIKADGTKTDFTNTAFQYADTKPEKFMELLKAEIDKELK